MCRYMLSSLFKLEKIYNCKILNNHVLNIKCISTKQNYLNKTSSKNEDLDDTNNKNNLTRNYNNKYKIFRDEEAPVIFDINEEKERIKLADLELDEKETDPYDGINLNRGIHGVFDIEDLVDLLRKDKNNRQIFVALVPHEYNYVDYMVLVTGKSAKHMNALAMYVRKIYKAKKHKNDFIPKIEGKNNNDWIALDLGNIALHIFNYETRLKYDLETLWSVGSNYDTLSRERIDDDLTEKYKDFLKTLQPAE